MARISTTNRSLTATITNGSGTSRLDASLAKDKAAEALALAEHALILMEELGASIESIQKFKDMVSDLLGVFETVEDLTVYTAAHKQDSTLINDWCVVLDNGKKQTCIYKYIQTDLENAVYDWKEICVIDKNITITPEENVLNESERDLLFTLHIANEDFPIYSTISRNDFTSAIDRLDRALKAESERAQGVEKRLSIDLKEETERAKAAEKDLDDKKVPRRLKVFDDGRTEDKALRELSYVFVDQDGKDTKVSLAALRNLTTRIIIKKDSEELDNSRCMKGDLVVEFQE